MSSAFVNMLDISFNKFSFHIVIFRSLFIFCTSWYLAKSFFSRNVCLVVVKRVFAAAIFCFKRATFFQPIPAWFSFSFPITGFCLLFLPILRYFIYSTPATGPPVLPPLHTLPPPPLKNFNQLNLHPVIKFIHYGHVQSTCKDLRVFYCVEDVMAKLTSCTLLQKLSFRLLCTQVVLWITSCVKNKS